MAADLTANPIELLAYAHQQHRAMPQLAEGAMKVFLCDRADRPWLPQLLSSSLTNDIVRTRILK
jgi:hypothetical protein